MKHSLGLLTCLLLAPLAVLQCEDKRPQNLSEAEARQYREAAEYSRSAHGVAVLVMRSGEIVFEDYAPGWQDKPHELASGTKSFAGVMAVCAAQDGLLKLDEKVSDTVTEWKTNPRKSVHAFSAQTGKPVPMGITAHRVVAVQTRMHELLHDLKSIIGLATLRLTQSLTPLEWVLLLTVVLWWSLILLAWTALGR